jgi:hemoglobin
VNDFTARALADPRIKQKFARSDGARLVSMLVEQVCAATGGPCKYTGRSMKAAHAGMGVTEGEFAALVEDLTASLVHLSVPEAERKELLAILGTMKGDIVEVPGDATGTPLPAGFRPWQPPKPPSPKPQAKP